MGRKSCCFTHSWKWRIVLLKLLRPDLNPGLEHPVTLVAFTPALDVDRLQEPHLLEQFKRADTAVAVEGRLGRLLDAFLEAALHAKLDSSDAIKQVIGSSMQASSLDCRTHLGTAPTL